jgi:predicted nucleic acid-binding protein
MSVRSFLDTNVVVYAFDQLSPTKCAVARRLITDGAVNKQTFISYQVVQEFVNVALRGFKITVSRSDLETFMVGALFPMMAVSSSPALMIEALRLQAADNVSWYDALIVAAALQARCQLLLSEDLQHGRRFGALTVSNPFKA